MLTWVSREKTWIGVKFVPMNCWIMHSRLGYRRVSSGMHKLSGREPALAYSAAMRWAMLKIRYVRVPALLRSRYERCYQRPTAARNGAG